MIELTALYARSGKFSATKELAAQWVWKNGNVWSVNLAMHNPQKPGSFQDYRKGVVSRKAEGLRRQCVEQ
jgi:hypothetical protein